MIELIGTSTSDLASNSAVAGAIIAAVAAIIGAVAAGLFAVWRDHTRWVRTEQTRFNSERAQAYWRYAIAAERLFGVGLWPSRPEIWNELWEVYLRSQLLGSEEVVKQAEVLWRECTDRTHEFSAAEEAGKSDREKADLQTRLRHGLRPIIAEYIRQARKDLGLPNPNKVAQAYQAAPLPADYQAPE
jgi:hypothetical protein